MCCCFRLVSKFDKQKFVTCYTFGGHTNIAGGRIRPPGRLLDSPALNKLSNQPELSKGFGTWCDCRVTYSSFM